MEFYQDQQPDDVTTSTEKAEPSSKTQPGVDQATNPYAGMSDLELSMAKTARSKKRQSGK